jgi:hypothetical protein
VFYRYDGERVSILAFAVVFILLTSPLQRLAPDAPAILLVKVPDAT